MNILRNKVNDIRFCGIAVVLLACLAALQVGSLLAADAADANTPVTQARKPPMEMVRTVSFRLKDGRTVSGRVVNDDRAQVTVSEPTGGTFASSSYSRLDIEPRSISYQSLSEYQYWMNMGQYFEGRTWDFKDDADEFAQALRCYQSAHDLAAASTGDESAVTRDVEARIAKLLDSRKRWIEDAEPRAKMAELELKSTLAAKLDAMSDAINSLKTDVGQLNRSRSSYETSLASYQRDVEARLGRMADDIQRNYEYIRDNIYRSTIIVPGTTVTPK